MPILATFCGQVASLPTCHNGRRSHGYSARRRWQRAPLDPATPIRDKEETEVRNILCATVGKKMQILGGWTDTFFGGFIGIPLRRGIVLITLKDQKVKNKL